MLMDMKPEWYAALETLPVGDVRIHVPMARRRVKTETERKYCRYMYSAGKRFRACSRTSRSHALRLPCD